jgi:molybdopterin-guanine dinucleotide biosynthesis protein B
VSRWPPCLQETAAPPGFLRGAFFPTISDMGDLEEIDSRTAAVSRPALVAIVGKSDSGKTTLIEKLVPELVKLGLRVGTVKHDAHSFEIDHPGKDSWRHGQAGAEAYVIASPERLAFIARLDGELPLTEIVRRYYDGFDIVVAEGYKRTAPHRVELFRVGAGHAEPLCAPGEAMALVTDADLDHEHRFGLEDGAGLAAFLSARLDLLRAY